VPEPSALDPLERTIVDHALEFLPGYGVSLGLHEYDGRLPDWGHESTDRWARRADALLAELSALDAASLPAARRVDRFLLQLLLESPLFDLRDARSFERNPMVYVGEVSLSPYITRAYAPAEVRADAATRLLAAVPGFLAQGRARLTGALPRPFVDLGIVMGEGLHSHFDEAAAFAAHAGRGEGFERARTAAEAAVTGFVEWLKADGRAHATSDFALGAETFQRLLFVREGVRSPFDEIRRAGAADLARNQVRLAEIARQEQVDLPGLFDRMNGGHPTADGLIPAARAYVEEAKTFVRSTDLVTMPEATAYRVEPTPEWGRALTTASMDSPGPFETGSSEGIYYVTPVDPSWTPGQQEQWLRSFNHSVLRNVTIHEVFPGHYLQHLHLRASPASLVRQVYRSSSFTEGWAHYTEQLAIEAGLGGGDPLAEVAELHDALLRDCRLLASIGLHTEGWTLEQATQLFQREGHFERLPAEREALRGTFNPEYFCYTLGKLAILDARRRHLETRFGGRLKAFHDATLRFGAPPIGLLDELLREAG
jgi:uncharacterized protein (DUF885 family)